VEEEDDYNLLFDRLEPVMGEVVDDPFEAVRAGSLECHDNLAYLPTIELASGPRRRIEARLCQIFRHDSGEYHHTRLELIYFRRRRSVGGFTVDRKAALDGAALEKLVSGLLQVPKFQTMSLHGAARTLLLPLGKSATLPHDELVMLTDNLANLLSTRASLDVIRQGRLTIDALSNIEAAAQHARFKKAAEELRSMIADPTLLEQDYQRWFEDHPWVFGTEYVRRIKTRSIGLRSKADILLLSVDGFVDVFELKLPSETILQYDRSHETYYHSAEVSKALSQVAHYLSVINENRLMLERDWGEQVIFRPRAIVVIGRSDTWTTSQRESWRNLRRSIHDIDLLTFDHVLARADGMITQYEQGANNHAE
jgi:Domain of unknown function (DUF4263)